MTIKAVPCNIITGFLGVGKTSSILNLLKQKPENERWAVLVNEFGEIGIDGKLIESQQQDQIFVREVPGGCMCCAAGLPMHIALNQLLQRAKPDRLLIEPSGLGHPKEVMEVLHAEHYQDVLDIQKCLTLIDARKLNDERYTENPIFLQQVNIADVVVANKEDLYRPEHKQLLHSFLETQGKSQVKTVFCSQGDFPFELLSGASDFQLKKCCSHHHNSTAEEESAEEALASNSFEEAVIPQEGFISQSNSSEEFSSIGWRFSPNVLFNHSKLYAWANELLAERMKAVCITESGVWGFNKTPDGLQEIELDDCMESRFEIIASKLDPNWEKQLLDCRLPSA